MIVDILAEKFQLLNIGKTIDNYMVIEADKKELKGIVYTLKALKEFDCDMLLSIVGNDLREYFQLDYLLYSSKLASTLIISIKLTKDNPQISSIVDIFPSANWEEREIYDLFGITFIEHTNLKRLLLP